MNITPIRITVRELSKDYLDRLEKGVRAYANKLDVRPAYQREFVYNDKQRLAVIDTIFNGYPLNVMYWSVRGDDTYEVIDGQQRTISICQYVTGEFAHQGRFFANLQEDEKELVLNYELTVYLCEGTDSERLGWFRTINIAGEKLTEQELLNAVYAGTWLEDAKKHFSKTGCAAYEIGKDYLKGSPIRQDFLETTIKWINGGDIEGYMAAMQHKPNASALWLYYQEVINWVKVTFPNTRKEMKGLAWGTFYNQYRHMELDANKLEELIHVLMKDEDVTKKSGIYEFVLSGDEKTLNIRQFTENQKREAYERQGGICPVCTKHFELSEMQADHITPWSKGGKTVSDNCKMLCADDNRRKSDV